MRSQSSNFTIGTVSSMAAKIFFLTLLLAICQVHSVVFKLEAEDFANGPGQVNSRSLASNGKSLVRGQFDKGAIYNTFCMKDAGEFQVLEVGVSNDGDRDIFEVFVDDVSYGMGQSVQRTDAGRMWDVFSTAGPFRKMSIDAGAHILKIVVRNTDVYGIEFDYITVEASNSNMEISDFVCNVMCVNDDDAISSLTTNIDIRKAGVTVDLMASTCPVNSNVKVRFYHNVATTYKLEAIRPYYRTFLNKGLEGMTQCESPVSTLWKYAGFTASPQLDAASIQLTSGAAVVSVKDSGNSASEVDVTFSLEGPTAGTYLSEIGSVLTLKVLQATADLKITLRYKKGGSNNWSNDMTVTVTSDTATWNIPDYAWNEGQGNSIQLSIPHGVVIDYIELKKREEAGETVEELWRSDAYIIEGVNKDFWWMSPAVMTVKWHKESQLLVKFYDYIRVRASLIPGANSQKTEIFTLYQDGRIRMVPLPAEGQDSVPFGSYAVLGQPDDSHVRPSSPIEQVEIDVDRLEFKVSFYSGQVQLFLSILQDKTVLEVKLNDRFYDNNPDHNPFMLIHSRYIDDGMSEIDHVAADGGVVKHLKDFSQNEVMNGTSFVFYRRCISHLNTQSEGLVVHMLSPPQT